MKLSQLVLTLALIGGGIVVYDQVLRPTQPVDPLAGVGVVREVVRENGTAEVIAPIHLEGTGAERKIAELEQRLAALEGRSGGGARLEAVLDETASERQGTSSEVDEILAEDGEEREARTQFTEQELEEFRAKLEVVERRQRMQRSIRDMNRMLDRLGVKLTDDQRKDVIKATLDYRSKLRERMRGTSGTEMTREERRAQFETVREEYQQTLYSLIPSAEADTIVQGMSRTSSRGDRGQGRGPRGGGGR